MNSSAHAADLRYRQGTIPDPMHYATSIDLSENNSKMLGDCTLADMKNFAPREAYSESTSTAFSHSAER